MNSVWSEMTARQVDLPLDDNITTDVLVVGGGLCGMLTAHRLQAAGVRCVVVEAKAVGSGITKNTTAKITAQHGLIYADLVKRRGVEKARQYYDANMRAIGNYRTLAEQFSCDFEEKAAYVYSTDDRYKLENEAKAYHELGITSRIEESPPLPIDTVGAIAMGGQAQFHPLKLLYSLAEGLKIYENTLIYKVEGRVAYTANGRKITAKHIVLCTHYPLINVPGLYFLKLYQHRSYVLALENAPLLDGMYLDEHRNGHSFRVYGNLLFVGGGDHKTGKRGGNYAALEALAAQVYPNAAIRYHWATQDCMSLDGVPYIGRHRAGKENLYVATGFNKWGMTGSMVAAELLCDLIVHGQSDLEDLYSPQRSMLSSQLLMNIGGAAKGLLSIGGPRCAHMGCKLHWNAVEKSWDCSCHGSRFCESGQVIDNPAKKELRR